MPISFWKVWIDARTEEKAAKVFQKVLNCMNCQAINVTTEPYPMIKGFVTRFEIEMENEGWNDRVVEIIATGQRVAHAWVMTGNIEDDANASSGAARVAGVQSIEWRLGDRLKQ